MKRIAAGLAACVMVLALASQASAQITGSAHDFSGATWNSSGEICIVCHTPHNANTNFDPLWNHEASTATYTPYTGVDLQGTIGAPNGSALLCLSCHDGTVAVDNYGGVTTGTATMGTINANADLGVDLSNDHPVSITYTSTTATADGALYDPSVDPSGMGGTIQADMLDASNQVQCASCHDVHNAYGNSYLLNVPNTGSALCMTCHAK